MEATKNLKNLISSASFKLHILIYSHTRKGIHEFIYTHINNYLQEGVKIMYRDLKTKRIAVIPAYEPDNNLINVASEAAAAGFDVVVVDDGSENGRTVKEGTVQAEVYHKIFEDTKFFAHVIRYPENRGKGFAMKTAFSYISKTYEDAYTVVVIDSDGQHKVADAVRLSDYAAVHRDTLVLGSRRQGPDSPLRSRIGNGITRNVFSMMSGVKIYDTQTGLRAFSDELLKPMLAVSGDRYEYEMNMLMAFAKEHIKMKELPIETIYINNNAGSHFNAIKDSIRIYREIFKFSASSFASFLIDYGIFGCIVGLFGSSSGTTLFANVFARFISATANYSINRNFVFAGTDNEFYESENQSKAEVTSSAAKYALLAVGILVFNTMILYLITEKTMINPMVGKIITECIMFIFSFIFQKHFVFRKKEIKEKESTKDHTMISAADDSMRKEENGVSNKQSMHDYGIA